MSAEFRYGPAEFLGGVPHREAEAARRALEGASGAVRAGAETVQSPPWYTSGAIETCDKVEAVIDGLPAREAWCLAQVLRYFDRAGLKDDPGTDLGKANNYAHRLVTGEWREARDER